MNRNPTAPAQTSRINPTKNTIETMARVYGARFLELNSAADFSSETRGDWFAHTVPTRANYWIF